MPELKDLYQEVILEHRKQPHNFCVLASANRTAEGYNPLCGDRLTLYLEVYNNIICGASFQGSGCAILLASASLLTDSVKGKTVREAKDLFDRLRRMLLSSNGLPKPNGLGKLSVLAGVRAFPARVECALLAWQTLMAALKSADAPSTAMRRNAG